MKIKEIKKKLIKYNFLIFVIIFFIFSHLGRSSNSNNIQKWNSVLTSFTTFVLSHNKQINLLENQDIHKCQSFIKNHIKNIEELVKEKNMLIIFGNYNKENYKEIWPNIELPTQDFQHKILEPLTIKIMKDNNLTKLPNKKNTVLMGCVKNNLIFIMFLKGQRQDNIEFSFIKFK